MKYIKLLEEVFEEDWEEEEKLTEIEEVINLFGIRPTIDGSIKLSYYKIKSISGLAFLPNEVKSVDLFHNEITKIDVHNPITNIDILSLQRNKLKSLDGIEKFPNLIGLSVSNNNLKNLNGIEKLSELKSLYCVQCSLKNIDVIMGLDNLETIYAYHNDFSLLYKYKMKRYCKNNGIDLTI